MEIGIKFAYMVGTQEVASTAFIATHFGQLPPAEAGRLIRTAMYQIFDALCVHGINFAQDEKIISIDNCNTPIVSSRKYKLYLDEFSCYMYFWAQQNPAYYAFTFYHIEFATSV